MCKSQTPVMIFGAGFGTRMREMTKATPKPLIKVAGKPLIDHALDLTGDRPCVVNTHYHADQMRAHLAKRNTVTISHEATEILETGGGLKHALPLLGATPVVTLNSDAIWSGPNPLDMLDAAWKPEKMDALLLLVPRSRAVGFSRPGDFALDAQGRLTRDPEGMVYSGAQIIKTEGLNTIDGPAFSLWALWTKILERSRFFGLEYPGFWADVGTPEGIPLAEELIARDKDV